VPRQGDWPGTHQRLFSIQGLHTGTQRTTLREPAQCSALCSL